VSTATQRSIRRDPENGVVAGVCSGLGRSLGVDPLVFRVIFGVTAFAGLTGVVAYVLCWILIPRREAGDPVPPASRRGRGSWQTGLGVGLIALAVLLLLRELGIWSSDALVWPVVLAAAGGALVWRELVIRRTPVPSSTAPAVPAEAAEPAAPSTQYRGWFGIALVVGAGLLFLWANGALGGVRDVALALVVVIAGGALILAPLWVRMARSLSDERAERIRSQERTEVAAHLHDSVLQTLAMIQKRSDDPSVVAGLARRQERELRRWLTGAPPLGQASDFESALQSAAEEVEGEHGVQIDVVVVGEAELASGAAALVAAAREAMINASKYGEHLPVSVFAEAGAEKLSVFVRDRGRGFDPDNVPEERRGIRDSIFARLESHGGRARIWSGRDEGTEVEMEVPSA
jgi:signal transduction histidine kinase/phage shock protein PspC (stress-responsive transcriptional regulator)